MNNIGVTEQKINERIKEHQGDIKNGKNSTAVARLALNENIKTDLKKPKSFQIITRNQNYNKKPEIKNNNRACNDIEHYFLDLEWQRIISKKTIHREKEEKMNRTTEGERTSNQLKNVLAYCTKRSQMSLK